jgi:alkylation response protein AidB-like acyl-CoA dehydrogenase
VDFRFTDDQRLVQQTVRDLLAKECTPQHVRAAWDGDGVVPGLWAKLAALGVIGLCAAERDGGLGLDETDLVLLLEEAGRVALPGPLLETAAVAAPFLRDIGETEWASQLASGNAVATVWFESELHVVGGDLADVVLEVCGDDICLWSRPQVVATEQPSVDRGRRRWSLQLGEGSGFVAAGAAIAFDRAALGAAAQLVGVADQLIAMTAAYAREREQFGRPIGSFQAVKHHLANARLALEFTRPAVYRAAHSVATGDAHRSRDVSMAKVFASDAAMLAARVGLQVHGAIGYTWEHDLHLWMKSAWSLAAQYGDARWHRARVARALGLGGTDD